MITAVFEKDEYYKSVYGLWQYDYGQKLQIQGLTLPAATEIHFALRDKGGETVTRIGVSADGMTDVNIPDSMLENNGTTQDYSIFAFVYLTDDVSGRTVYKIRMPVKSRPKPEERVDDGSATVADILAAINELAYKVALPASVTKIRPLEEIVNYNAELKINSLLTSINLSASTSVDDGIAFRNTTSACTILNINFNSRMICNITLYASDMLLVLRQTKSIMVCMLKGIIQIYYDDAGEYVSSKVSYVAYRDDVLTRANTSEYTPTSDYHPATKKYVDDVGAQKIASPITAAVGQTICVTAVDDNGSPTAWEAVDMPSAATPRTEMSAEDTTAELQPNILYVFPEMTELTLALAEPENPAIVNEYHWIFISGETATVLTLPDSVRIPDGMEIEANKVYEISVLEGCLSYMSWDYAAEVTA